MSVKDDIAAGPRWQGVPPEESPPICLACSLRAGLYGEWLDKETGLCRPCWRAWRWASECHCDECCNDAVIAASVAEELAEAKP